MKRNITTKILWLSFFGVLIVLFPHAAWAFANWEPISAGEIYGTKIPQVLHYVAAFAFESVTAALVYKISKRIENTPKSKRVRRVENGEAKIITEPLTLFDKFLFRYANAFGFLLLVVTIISIMGNLAHAVEFGRSLKIFAEWGIPKELYSVAFGGILPIVSLGFASVLSEVTDAEDAPNPELTALNEQLKTVRLQLRESEQQRKITEQATRSAEEKAKLAEERFGAAGDLMKRLFGDDKRERILAIKQWKPDLNNAAISIIAEATPSHVSETLAKASLN